MVEQRLQQESRVVRLAVPTPGAGKLPDEGDVTFWDKLGKGTEPTQPHAAPPTPTVAPSSVRIAPPTRAPEPRRAEAPSQPSPLADAEGGGIPPTVPSSKAAAVEGGNYQVQVNAMADKARAEQLVRDLQSLGYRAFISSAKVADKTLFRVRVGSLPSVAAAKEAVGRLREQGYPNAFVAAEVAE
jgi:cell division septation protein DedD